MKWIRLSIADSRETVCSGARFETIKTSECLTEPLKRGFFIPKFDLSESCQKKTEFFYFGKTHKTLVKIGGRGGIRTPGSLTTTSDFESDAFNHSATLPTD